MIVLGSILTSIVMLSILVALGARIRALIHLPSRRTLRFPIDLSLGVWVFACVVLAQSLAGLTSAYSFVATLTVCALCGRWRCRDYSTFGLGIALVSGLASLSVALCPPFFYDAMTYHLGLPWQMLQDGRLLAHPENIFSTFPPLAQLVAAPVLAFQLNRLPALLHLFAWIATSVAAQHVVARAGAPRFSRWLLGAAVMLVPVAPLVPGFPAAESWLLLPLVTAVALAVDRQPVFPMLGLLAGIATAARLQALPWTVLLMILIAWRSRSLRTCSIACAAWTLGALPWWLKNLVLIGDPIAPVLWQREGLETLWRDSNSLLKAGHNIFDSLCQLPLLITSELVYLLPLLVLGMCSARHPRPSKTFVVLAFTGLLMWPLTGALPRFLALTVLLFLVAVGSLAETRFWRLVGALALLLCGISGALRSASLIRVIDPLELMTLPVAEATHRVLPNDPQRAFQKLTTLSSAAKILMIGEPRGFGCPRPFIAPSQHDPSPLRGILAQSADPSAVVVQLRAKGLTHILVNWRELNRLQSAYPVTPWNNDITRKRWSDLLRYLGPPALARDGIDLYAFPDSDSGRGE